jgi:lipopolysaccharide transport system ATP-binding protein
MKSDTEPAIIATGIGKRFRRYPGDRVWTFQELLVNGFRGFRSESFWGLRDVSFSVERGRTLGIIGRNGAGKSTLLRLLGGIGVPDTGQIQVYGTVSGLLALGAGFHGDLTGRENVFVAGVIGGATRRQVAERFDSIVNFAEARDFIEAPVRTYSSGMLMRLAFAVAVHVEPGVLLMDEVLAVGDVAFQNKCLKRIAAMKREGTTIVLVSHDESTIRTLCDVVLWLDCGQALAIGPAAEVVELYLADLASRAQRAIEEETRRRTPSDGMAIRTRHGYQLQLRKNRLGSQEAQILDVHVKGPNDHETFEISSGDPLSIEIDYGARAPVVGAIFSIAITDSRGQVWLDVASDHDLVNLGVLDGSGQVILRVDRLDLPEGVYGIGLGIYERSWTYAYDTHYGVYPLTVRGNRKVLRAVPPLQAETRWFHVVGGIAEWRSPGA